MRARDVNRRIESLGGRMTGQRGSHRHFESPLVQYETLWEAVILLNGKRYVVKTTVPQHGSKDIPTGTLRQIQKDMQMAFGEGWLLGGK